MCLITFAYKSHPTYSLILLANRDEFYARPSTTMQFWSENPELLAGKDLEQGGTWLGLTKKGKFAAVTNFRDGRTSKQNPKSRGHLTRNFLLNNQSSDDYLQQLSEVQSDYGDYNLLVGDETGLFYHSNRSGNYQKLTPGIYGLSNALLDTPWPKLDRVKSELVHALKANSLEEPQLLNIMANTTLAELDQLPDTGIAQSWEHLLSSCFIQSPEEGYGTRATTLILQKETGETLIIEKSFDPKGQTGEQRFELHLNPLG